MTLTTESEEFAKLTEYIRKAQETAATLAHLCNANDHKAAARGWLAVSEQMRVMNAIIIQIAKGKLN